MKHSLSFSLLSLLAVTNSLPTSTRTFLAERSAEDVKEPTFSPIPLLGVGDLSDLDIEFDDPSPTFKPIERIDKRTPRIQKHASPKPADPVDNEPWPAPPEVPNDSPGPFDQTQTFVNNKDSQQDINTAPLWIDPQNEVRLPVAPTGLAVGSQAAGEEGVQIIMIEIESDDTEVVQEGHDLEKRHEPEQEDVDKEHVPAGGPIVEHPDKMPKGGAAPPSSRRRI